MKSVRPLGWERLVSRANADPFFLGSALASYKASHGLNHDELAGWLECSLRNLDRLALCRLPDREEHLPRDIQRIAKFGDCNADRLVAALREVATLAALSKEGETAHTSFLMAARDRKKQNSEDDG